MYIVMSRMNFGKVRPVQFLKSCFNEIRRYNYTHFVVSKQRNYTHFVVPLQLSSFISVKCNY
jgi:hypothetical protein